MPVIPRWRPSQASEPKRKSICLPWAWEERRWRPRMVRERRVVEVSRKIRFCEWR